MFLLCFILTYGLFHSLIESLDPNALTAIAYWGLFAMATVWISVKQKRFPLKALPFGLLCIAASLSFLLHNDPDLHVALFLLLIPLSGFYCITLTGANVHSFGSFYVLLDLMHCELLIPLRHLFAPMTERIDALKARRAAKETVKRQRAWLPVVIGLLVAIPVLLVVIPLLINADAAFESFAGAAYAAVQKALEAVGDFIAAYFPFNGFALFLALLFTPYILAVMYSFANDKAKAENTDTSCTYRNLQRAPLPFFATLLGVVSAVYVVYLLSQTAYFFSAFSGHLPSGAEITVTEYARRGFFEMVKLAGVNFMLLALSFGFCKRDCNRLPKALKALDAFLCAFTMLLCTISLSKIVLYIRDFGMTEKRIYVFAADIALFFVFAAIFLRLFMEKFPYMKVMLAAVFLTAATLGVIGVNNTIAKYNTNRLLGETSQSRRFVDVWVDCGDAGLPYLQRIAASDTDYAKPAQERLDDIYIYESFRRDEPFYNFEQSRFVIAVQANGVDQESLILEIHFDCAEPVYALGYGCYVNGEIIFGGGMEHADKSPLENNERLELQCADLPEGTAPEDLELRVSLRFTPEDEGKSFDVINESESLLKGAGFGDYCNISIIQKEDGTYVAW